MLLPLLVYTELFYIVFNAIKSKVTVKYRKIKSIPFYCNALHPTLDVTW